MPAYSSSRYSPKSHSAVKNTTSNTAKKPIPFHSIKGSGNIRLTEVAKLAGVSPITASRFFRTPEALSAGKRVP